MIRQRLYNQAHLTPDELKESFVARSDTLAEMLRLLEEQTPGHPCQHMILIGARGMGKTTLGLRFLHAIDERPDLRKHWQPVAFHEESYGIVNLADFWVHALRHLTRATGDSRWEDRAGALEKDERDVERLAAYALATLLDFCTESEKRLILFVENIDGVFGQIRDEREIHLLRATLIERPQILLLGSANAFFEAISGYGEPLYEFFRVFKLEGIGREDAGRILKAAVDLDGRSEVADALNRDQGRLEVIRRLTGGNPRLLVLACRMLIESPLGSAMEDLARLIDEQTPYFKARIEELPVQARRVFHCLAEGWKPMLAKEVAGAAKLSSSHASAQLRQLMERGYVRELRLVAETRTRYEVGDRFYNIYFLLRFSRTARDRLERLVAFLHDLFGPSGIRARYPAALETLRARDGAWAGWARTILLHRDAGRLPATEECARRAMELEPEDPNVLYTLSDVLAWAGKWAEGVMRLEHALRVGGSELWERERRGLTESLMRAVAAGHGGRVRRMMENAGLAEPLEPLWHAVRAEMGEELEALPAEVMEAVREVRRRLSGDRASE